jgi:hypothetical protein
MSTTALSLYQVEDFQQALLESADLIETDEERADYDAQLAGAIEVSIEKRDSVGGFWAELDGRIAAIQAEKERLNKLEKRYQRIIDRIQRAVMRTLEHIGKKELAGRTHLLTLCANPPKVAITQESEIPAEYKVLTIKVPATAFEELMEAAFPGDKERFLKAVIKSEVSIDRNAIKRANEEIPGVEVIQSMRVERR